MSRGILSIQPMDIHSVNALYTAQMLAALPTGKAMTSGTWKSSWSTISKATDFCPSGRKGLMELSR